MNPVVTLGTTEMTSTNGFAVQSLGISARIAGRATASVSCIADSSVVAPSSFAIGTPVTIGGLFSNQPANDAIEVLSSDAGDTTQHILIVGYNASGSLIYQSIALNGTTPVTSSASNWQTVLTCELDATCSGTVTVREASGNQTIVTISPGVMYVSDRLFSGFLQNVRVRKAIETAASTRMAYELDFVDVAAVFDRRVCCQDYADTTIQAILNDLFSDILTAEGFVMSWGGVSQILIGSTDVENLNGMYRPVSEILDDLARLAGCAWWVDPYRCLHMADAGDSQPATPFALSESAPVRNLSHETTRGDYRNREYFVYDQVWDTTYTVHRSGDGKTNTFPLCPNVYHIADHAVTVDSITRVVRADKDKDILVTSVAGAQFGNVPCSAADKLEAEADDPNDDREVTVIYITDTGVPFIETKTLPCGSPNIVQFTYTNMQRLCAVKLGNGSPGVGTSVEVRGTVGSPVTSYVTIDGSNDQTAGVQLTEDTETYYVKPTIRVTNDPTHATTRWCIISYTNTAGTTDQYQAVSLGSGVLTGTFDTVAKTVEEVYVGDFYNAEQVSLYCEAEYQYSVNGTSVRQSANGAVPGDGVPVDITYTPMWKSVYVETDGGEQTHTEMAALEGSGTGYYDHATVEQEPIPQSEATARAAALGDKYGDFPRKVSFETNADWFFPGSRLTVNLASNFGVDGDVYIVSEVDIRQELDTVVDEYRCTYGVTAVYGEDYSAFDRLEVYRRMKQKGRVWVPENNINT